MFIFGWTINATSEIKYLNQDYSNFSLLWYEQTTTKKYLREISSWFPHCHWTRQTVFFLFCFSSLHRTRCFLTVIRMFICLTYMQNEPQACVWMEICSPRADNLGGMVGCRPIWAVYKQLYEISALTAFKICLKEWQNVCVCLLSFALKLYSPEYISIISHHSSHPQMRSVRCWAEGEFTYCGNLTKQLCHFSFFFHHKPRVSL